MTGSRAALRWFLASSAVIAAHLGLAQALMAVSRAGPPLAPPAPVFVDLVAPPAPEPVATSDPPPEPTPEPEPAPADPGLPPEVLERPELADVPQMPEPPLAEQLAEPMETAEPAQLPTIPTGLTPLPPVTDLAEQFAPVESPRPSARPRRIVQREEPRRAKPAPPPRQPQPKRVRRQPEASRKAAKPAAQAPARSAAQSSSGSSGSATRKSATQASPSAMRKWQSDAGARIARHMKRSRISARGRQMQVRVAISVGANGRASARLASSTGDSRVDSALARQAARIPHLPAPPDRRSHSFVLPIRIAF